MYSLYGHSIGKDIDEEYIIRSENWPLKINNVRVVEYEPLPSGEHVINYRSSPGID